MKKVLLLSALVLTMSAQAFAQKKVLPQDVKLRTIDNMEMVKNIGRAPVASVQMNTKAVAASRAPRKVVSNGLWFQRPEGSLWMRFNSTASCVMQPPFTDVTYINKATNPDQTTWAIYYQSGLTDVDADPDYNLTWSYYGFGGYYMPVLQSGTSTYSFGDEAEDSSVLPYSYELDSIYSVSNVNYNGGTWSGFTNGYVFGTYTNTFEDENGNAYDVKADAIHEFFEKPARPLYVTDIWFYTTSDVKDFLPEDVEMKLVIRKQGTKTLMSDEVIAEIPFTINDTIWTGQYTNGEGYYGAFLIEQKEVDLFGQVYQVPIIIDDAFVISIEGFDQDGVDFSLYMTDVMNIPTDFYDNDGKVFPTMRTYVRADDGTPLDGFYYTQYISPNDPDPDRARYARQYNVNLYLDAFYDVVEPYEECKTMNALEEGGYIYFLSEEENDEGDLETVAYQSLQYHATLPRLSEWEGMEGEDNYYFVGETDEEEMPEWLHVEEFNDHYFSANYGYTELAFISADPLPDGMDGRIGRFRIVSDRGADSGLITVIQGNAIDGIVTVSTGGKVKATEATYNLAGQKVNGAFKGITVKGGKKFLTK